MMRTIPVTTQRTHLLRKIGNKPALYAMLLSGALFGVAMVPEARAYDDQVGSVKVNTPGDGFLALRSEPSAKRGQRLTKIPHGTYLQLATCEVNVQGETWCETNYHGFTGWVYQKYVLPVSTEVTPQMVSGARPVMVGGDPEFDACGSMGMVSGLKPGGDGFLALRAGPSSQAALLDKLYTGEIVYICDAVGGWYGVVVVPANPERQCGVSSPIMPQQPYNGPCESGWVSSKWIEVTAG